MELDTGVKRKIEVDEDKGTFTKEEVDRERTPHGRSNSRVSFADEERSESGTSHLTPRELSVRRIMPTKQPKNPALFPPNPKHENSAKDETQSSPTARPISVDFSDIRDHLVKVPTATIKIQCGEDDVFNESQNIPDLPDSPLRDENGIFGQSGAGDFSSTIGDSSL